MKNNCIFWVSLILSLVAVVVCFRTADSVRGYNAIGGEVFMLALPLMIVKEKVSALGQEIEKLKKQNQSQ